ncbi:MAG: LpxL/LpxP family Kdo(2)-lipid IV(A) lauroyl/palmitoleoyl acyltransferase [Steroidobacteraceae bacterium]
MPPLRLFAPRYWPTWLGLMLLRVLAPLPLPVLHTIGNALGRLMRYLPVGFVHIARRNIELCLPELSATQREQLLSEHFASIGIALFETALAWWASDQRIQRMTQVEGLEHLYAAQAHGKGVILLSAHFTTLEIGARALAARMPLNVMYRPTNNEVMERFLSRNRALRAKRAIRRDDVRTLVTALKGNEPVWYAPDQSYRNKGAQMVPFFGTLCATNVATSRLAKMTGATVLPYFPERLANGGYRMQILPPIADFPSDDAIADATHFHQLIEAHVRKVPAQYLWIHRRFKGLSDSYPDYYARANRN